MHIRDIIHNNNSTTNQTLNINETVTTNYTHEFTLPDDIVLDSTYTETKWNLPQMLKVSNDKYINSTEITGSLSDLSKLHYQEQSTNNFKGTVTIAPRTCTKTTIATKSLSNTSVDVLMTIKITGKLDTLSGTEIKKLLRYKVKVIETGPKHVIAEYKTTGSNSFNSGIFVINKEIPCVSATEDNTLDIPNPSWLITLYRNKDLTDYITTFGASINGCMNLESFKGRFLSLDTQYCNKIGWPDRLELGSDA